MGVAGCEFQVTGYRLNLEKNPFMNKTSSEPDRLPNSTVQQFNSSTVQQFNKRIY